jgi:hypothetical protein
VLLHQKTSAGISETAFQCQKETPAPQQRSGRAFLAVIFGYLSIECPFNKFYGINCRLKLAAKLLDRFFHWRRLISPPVNNATHRFFDGSQHFLYCNFTVGSRHSASRLDVMHGVMPSLGCHLVRHLSAWY